ncbi:MAG: Gfo/Idh/MocA family oxidoreductase [Rhodothermales bacterium]|nr:Gfo/Idh/MocA family oxidoreductase [Rhodothermales bacterium]
MARKLRYGMVGGGPGAFIGAVHRSAIALDGQAVLVAGAFSSDPAKSREQGHELGISESRTYDTYEQMASVEKSLPADQRIDFVSIVTPNNTHFPVAKTFAEHGFHIVCDKPMTTTLADALELSHVVREAGVIFALTHNYTGYPMVKEARHIVHAGELGIIKKVVVEYPQGWLSTLVEDDGQKQASWRTDPKIAGAGALGDIGSHAENLVRYITGLRIAEMCADVSTIVPGRLVDDDANILVHYEGGARGIIYCSQVSVGEENALNVRIYGTKGAIEWDQESPNSLILKRQSEPTSVLRAGQPYLSEAAQSSTRLPPGHPEGFIEAFANIYQNAIGAMSALDQGLPLEELDLEYPDIDDGILGMHFIESALKSGRERRWIDASYELESER